MLLSELFESVSTTPSALEQLIFNANNMYTLYADVLTSRIKNMYAEGNHEDMLRTTKKVIGQAKGKWFQENYLSTSVRRDRPTTGLKNALLALAKDPKFQSAHSDLRNLGSFAINMSSQKQFETSGSSGQYVTELEAGLPRTLRALADKAPEKFQERLKVTSHRLKTAIENFYGLWGRLQDEWDRDWGTPDPERIAQEERKRQEAGKKAVAGSQAGAVENIVNQVLGGLDKKVAAELRPILARSDNKLATLQVELQKRGIKI